MVEETLARSPIAPPSPLVRLAGWEVGARTSTSKLTIVDCTPMAKVELRGDAVEALGVRFGHALRHETPGTGEAEGASRAGSRGFATAPSAERPDVPVAAPDAGEPDGFAAAPDDPRPGSVLVVGSAPGTWLALGPPGTATVVSGWLADTVADATATIVDVTHAHVLLRLTGERVREPLSRECAVDLGERATPNGAAFRTRVAGVSALVARDDRDGVPSFLVTADWSLGEYLFECLRDAGEEFGLDVAGFAAPTAAMDG